MLPSGMDDEYSPIPAGTRGTVVGVDDMLNLMVKWDNGSSLNAIIGHDEIRIMPAIPETVQNEIQAVRITGATNMFHWRNVVDIAEQCGFDELAAWLPGNTKLYSHYILTGETELP